MTGAAETINLKSVPYLGNWIEGRESEKAIDVILKAKNQPELLTKEEITDFDKYMNELNNQNLVGDSGSLTYKLGKSVLPVMKNSLEFAINTTVSGNPIGGVLVSALEPTRLYKNYQTKQLQGLIDITDKGQMFFSDLEKKPFWTTLYKAYATSLASDITETIGGAITNNPLTRSVIGKTTGVKKKILEALFGVSKRTGTSVDDLVNGLISEHLENVIEPLLAQILGANNNEYTWDNVAQAFEMPSWEEFLLTTGVIAIQGFTGLAMQKMVGKMQDRKVKLEGIETYMKNRKQEDVERDLKRLSEAEQQQFNNIKEQYKQDLRNTTNYTEEQINENMNLYDKIFSYGFVNFNDKDLSVNDWIKQYGFKILDSEINKKILGQYDVRERIISLSKESNPTTFQHEIMHWWKGNLGTFAEQGNKQAQTDLNILNKYVGAETNNWNREQEEIFARSWEQYLRKGIAPTKELQTVFDKIRDWFIEIYKLAKDIVVNGKPVKLDNNIINYFDNLLSLEPNKNIELDYNIKYDRLQNEVDNARETLYQEQPDFTEEEINAILRERFKEQLTPLEELQFKIKQENKKSIKQKVNDIFDTYQYDKKEFSEITNRIKDKIDKINKTLKNLKNKDLNVGNFNNMDITINDLIEIQKVAKQRLPRRPQTLTQWIKSIGGVYDEGGDVSQLEIKSLTRKSRYKRYGTKSNDYSDLSIDSVREKAIQQGFDIAENTTVADFINSISDDVGGNYIYRNQDMGRVAEYEQRLQQQGQAQEILDSLDVDVDSIVDLYRKAKQNNLKLLDKDKIKLVQQESKKAQEEVKNILKEIQNKEKTVKRELETKINKIKGKEKLTKKELEQKAKEEKQSTKNVKSKVIDMINNSNLENNDKAKFLNTIKKINSESDFEKQKDFILDRIKSYETSEVNKLIKNQINKKLNTIKDLKKDNRKVGRYEYQDNLLFTDLRQFNKNNKSQNEIELLNLLNNTPKNEINSTLFNIKERFLNYKINGANNSIDFSKQILKDIIDFKNVALENKQEIDNIKFNNKTFDIQEINNAIENSKANKDTLKTKITNTIYRTYIANIYSLINSITNKTVADKYNIEVAENNKSVALFTRVKQLKEDLKSALDIKQEKDIFKYLNKNRNKKFVLMDLNNSKQDINKMHILNIYAEMKNPLRKKQYINNYGESQINDLLNNLTEYDKKVADVFIKHFNEDGDYNIINKFYIEHFNKDLKKVDGVYIPSKSEFVKEEDFFNTFVADNVNSFSSLKERKNNEYIKPIPQDLYNNYIRHINQVEYIDKVAPTFKKIESLFINDNKNKNDIKYKFGDSVFETLKKQLNSLSFISDSEHLSGLDKIFNKIANNWVVSKIGFNPVVFIKQLSSVFGYVENVNVADWSKNLVKGMTNPTETIEFMKSNFPSIEIRYKNGFNETLNRANEFTKLGSLKNDLIQASTFLTRMGDAGSVIFGGYAQIQTDLQNGLSREQAFKNFEIQTMRSQQSGFNSSLSLGQQSKTIFSRLFYAFKNSPLQYLRKIYDSIIMYQNGDIDSKQLAKTLTLYLAIQPAIYRLLTEWGINLTKKKA